ncbi:MAG: VanZ family protein [Flavobacteriales bacterium]|nr:VanZ family protein [Flavobacteriales bacterium]
MIRNLRWALLWALLILVLCLMPGKALPSWQWADLFNVDKLVHLALFAVLLLLLARGLVNGGLSNRNALLASLVVAVSYGGLLELLQTLPALGRRGDLNDLLANTAGAVVAWSWLRWKGSEQRQAREAADT